MDNSKLLDRIAIPTPCPADWEQMAGDEQTRFCRFCQKHVYNFAAMDSDEILNIIREKEGHVCAQLYRRRDGTTVTSSCRNKRKGNFLQFSLASLMMLVTGTAAAFGLGSYVPREWVLLAKETVLSGRQAPVVPVQEEQWAHEGGALYILPEDLDELLQDSTDSPDGP